MQTQSDPSPVKMKTIEEHFKQKSGSFAQFVKEKEEYLESIESDRNERIASSRKAACELSWAA